MAGSTDITFFIYLCVCTL